MRLEGNLFNRLMESAKDPAPAVGMGATLLMYSDRVAFTIVEVRGDVVSVQADKAIRTDSNKMSDCQSYRYEPDPSAPIRKFSRRKNGRFVEVGCKASGSPLKIGVRDAYFDYGF